MNNNAWHPTREACLTRDDEDGQSSFILVLDLSPAILLNDKKKEMHPFSGSPLFVDNGFRLDFQDISMHLLRSEKTFDFSFFCNSARTCNNAFTKYRKSGSELEKAPFLVVHSPAL